MTRAGGDGSRQVAPGQLAHDQALHRDLEQILGAPVVMLSEVGSTNQELADRARDAALHGQTPEDLTLVATDFQSQGRGRLDRTWVVEPGEALTFSLLLRPAAPSGQPLPTQSFGWLTMLLSCAVVQALADHGVQAQVKWPNDVLVGNRKMVGVLASLVTFDHLPPAVVVGAGINVSSTHLPVDTATSVVLEGGTGDRALLLRAMVSRFLPIYRSYCADPTQLTRPDGTLRALVEGLLGTLGRRVRAELPGDQTPLEGQAVGLDDHGALIIRDDDGAHHHLNAGDVIHLRPVQEAR